MHSRELSSTKQEKDQTYTEIHPAARAIGSLSSGALEAAVGFPFDKIKNVRMLNGNPLTTDIMLETVFGTNYKKLSPFQTVSFVYRGFTAYGLHKMINRGLKLGFQAPLMEGIMRSPFYNAIKFSGLNDKDGKLVVSTLSGGLLGIVEVAANPIDKWKLICQVKGISSKEARREMAKDSIAKHYAGWQATMVRNFFGSGSLFFGKFLWYRINGVTDHNAPTFLQSFLSSMFGSVTSITVAHLPDVAKVHKQMNPSIKEEGIIGTLVHIVKTKGFSGLAAGYTTKITSSGVKLGLVMTTSDMSIKYINQFFQPKTKNVSNKLEEVKDADVKEKKEQQYRR